MSLDYQFPIQPGEPVKVPGPQGVRGSRAWQFTEPPAPNQTVDPTGNQYVEGDTGIVTQGDLKNFIFAFVNGEWANTGVQVGASDQQIADAVAAFLQANPPADGEDGQDGQKGEAGERGPKGEKGDRGDVGAQGPQGEQGPKGDVGATGPQGQAGTNATTTAAATASTAGLMSPADKVKLSMLVQGPIPVFVSTAPVTVTNTTAETSLIGAGVGNLIVQPGLVQPGGIFQLVARGTYNTGLVSALLGTLTIRAKLSNTVMATSVITLTNLTANMSNRGWEGSGATVFRSVGTSASAHTSGLIDYVGTGGNAVTEEFFNSTVTVNTAVPQTLGLTAQWSIASTANSLTVNQLYFTYTPPPSA